VPSPASSSTPATRRLRGLCLLLPLPWTKTTIPPGVIRHSQVAVQLDGARVGLHDLAAGRPASGTRDTGVRRGLPQGGTLQAGEDLLVGHLGELGVELPDGEESPGRADADQLVGVGADPGPPPGRRDGHGQHDPGRPLRPGDLAGGPGRGPGRDAVIDHHRHPPIQPLAGPPSPVAAARASTAACSRAWTSATLFLGTRASRMTSGLRTRTPSSPTTPMPSSDRNSTPSLRTTMTSSGAPSARATWNATGTPPRGRPRTTTGSPFRCPSRTASRRPASSRSAKTMTTPRDSFLAAGAVPPGTILTPGPTPGHHLEPAIPDTRTIPIHQPPSLYVLTAAPEQAHSAAAMPGISVVDRAG
jgi:hypothetical protein